MSLENNLFSAADNQDQPSQPTEEQKKYLQQHLALDDAGFKSLRILSTAELPSHYRQQLKFLADQRLDQIKIVIVPEKLWHKGQQPSESAAAKQLIAFNESYFKGQDEIAWLTHEMAHCQEYLNDPATYEDRMQQIAFSDLGSSGTYPNNKVEFFTFAKQFLYLKNEGKTQEEIRQLIRQEYKERDWPFFDKILTKIFS